MSLQARPAQKREALVPPQRRLERAYPPAACKTQTHHAEYTAPNNGSNFTPLFRCASEITLLIISCLPQKGDLKGKTRICWNPVSHLTWVRAPRHRVSVH